MTQTTTKPESNPSFWQIVLEALAGFMMILSLATIGYGIYQFVQDYQYEGYLFTSMGVGGLIVSLICMVVSEIGADNKAIREEIEHLVDMHEAARPQNPSA